MKNNELVKNVIMAFKKLSESCEYAKAPPPTDFIDNKNRDGFVDGDCHHPNLDFNCMCCDPSNCPLLLEYLE